MRRTERLVHVVVGELRQIRRERGIILCFAALEAQVLQHDEVPRFEAADVWLDRGAHHAWREGNVLSEQLAQARGDGRHRVLRVGRPLGPPEVSGHDDGGILRAQPLERRERGRDAQVVGDGAVLERNVEVDPHEDASPALEREVLETRDPEVSARQGTR